MPRAAHWTSMPGDGGDPVMVAKGGAALLSAEAARAVRERLLPLATVVTPNLPEAAVLLDVPEVCRRRCLPACRSSSSEFHGFFFAIRFD